METTTSTHVSKKSMWIAWTITGLLAIFLLFDAITKLLMVSQVITASVNLGYPESSIFGIGMILLISTVFYLVPYTSVLGAVLLTAYLGGATASHVRVGEPFYFPVIFGILIWVSLYIRNKQLRKLIPLTRNTSNQKFN